MRLYLVGSLRNPQIPSIARALRAAGHDVFDDWFAAGERADDSWREYEMARGHTYLEGLRGKAAEHIVDFDFANMITSDAAVLVAPAGKSAHLELGWFLGQGKPGHILLEPDTQRWDVMFRLATGVHNDLDALIAALNPVEIEGERWMVGR